MKNSKKSEKVSVAEAKRKLITVAQGFKALEVLSAFAATSEECKAIVTLQSAIWCEVPGPKCWHCARPLNVKRFSIGKYYYEDVDENHSPAQRYLCSACAPSFGVIDGQTRFGKRFGIIRHKTK